MSEEKYKPKYWNGQGKHQALYTWLYELLTPATGTARTTYGEALRIATKIVHDHYNNGDGNSDYISKIAGWLLDWAWNAEVKVAGSMPQITALCTFMASPDDDDALALTATDQQIDEAIDAITLAVYQLYLADGGDEFKGQGAE